MPREPEVGSRESIQQIVRDLALKDLDVVDRQVLLVQAQAEAQRTSAQGDIEVAGQSAAMMVARYDLPLPPPDLLQAYENQQAGLRKTMVDTWQADRNHQREQEKLAAERSHDLARESLSNERLAIRTRAWIRLVPAVLGLVVLGVVACFASPTATGIVAASEAVGAGLWAFIKRKPEQGGTEQ